MRAGAATAILPLKRHLPENGTQAEPKYGSDTICLRL